MGCGGSVPIDNSANVQVKEGDSNVQQTYAMIKPGFELNWNDVLKRLVAEGVTVEAIKPFKMDHEFINKFYRDHIGKPFFAKLSEYMSSGVVVGIRLSGPDVIAKWREILGPTNKEKALSEAPNSLRALFGRDTTENLCHGSDSPETAAYELGLVFDESLLQDAEGWVSLQGALPYKLHYLK